MDSEPTTAEKLRRLPWSIFSDATNAVYYYLSFFGAVFVLFLSELNLSTTQIGALLSLLPFAGLIAPFIAPAIARYGYKRVYLIFYGGRNFITAFLLGTPWILAAFGSQMVVWYIVFTMVVYSLCRAVALTAIYPWVQEYIPSSVRGKYSAINLMFWSLASFLAVTLGGYVLGPAPDLEDFSILFAVAVVFGLISLGAAGFIPGGAPRRHGTGTSASHGDLMVAIRDRNFVRYLVGAGLTLLAIGPLSSFLPLFLRDEVGLNPGAVVWLQAGTMIGGLLSSYVWGWAADRYGSKPVLASGAYLLAFQSLLWWLMPRGEMHFAALGPRLQPGLIPYIALLIASFQGMATLGWQIGAGRLLFVNIVPPEKKTGYLALYYAWISIVEGVGQLLGGRALDVTSGIAGQFLFLRLDPFSILFAAGFVLPLLNALLLRGVRAGSDLSVVEFAGFFLRGHPIRAADSLIRYHWARDERAAVSVTERMGQAKSPLTVDELVEALTDPRFYVRFEAIVSIARGGPDPRLTEALVEVLRGKGPALGVIAAWALGRIGDQQALPPLREGLDSPYRSIQIHCARSLGSLGDIEVVPRLLERLGSEPDEGVRAAFASALGALRAEAAVAQLLSFLQECQDEDTRMELALALARIIGNEHRFVQLWRQMRAEPGTAASQVITSLKRRMRRWVAHRPRDAGTISAIDQCAEAFARGDLERGAGLMASIIPLLLQTGPSTGSRAGPSAGSRAGPSAGSRTGPTETSVTILQECARRLDEFGAGRSEYVLLALHAVAEGW
jgi:MFS family permease